MGDGSPPVGPAPEGRPGDGITHLGRRGEARMVDVSLKPATAREAEARARVRMRPETLAAISEGRLPKGDVAAAARIAGIQAAKRAWELIPLCHPIPLTGVEVMVMPDPAGSAVEIAARVRATWVTGVEMEALAAVCVAALTVYDMAKAVDRGMEITDVRLIRKTGGQSGEWIRPGEAPPEGT